MDIRAGPGRARGGTDTVSLARHADIGDIMNARIVAGRDQLAILHTGRLVADVAFFRLHQDQNEPGHGRKANAAQEQDIDGPFAFALLFCIRRCQQVEPEHDERDREDE